MKKNLTLWDLIFGAISIIGLIVGLGYTEQLLIFASLVILFVGWLGHKVRGIEELTELSSIEIKNLNERVLIYERLADHNARIKNLEKKVQ